jgi:hypothetical protein
MGERVRAVRDRYYVFSKRGEVIFRCTSLQECCDQLAAMHDLVEAQSAQLEKARRQAEDAQRRLLELAELAQTAQLEKARRDGEDAQRRLLELAQRARDVLEAQHG